MDPGGKVGVVGNICCLDMWSPSVVEQLGITGRGQVDTFKFDLWHSTVASLVFLVFRGYSYSLQM